MEFGIDWSDENEKTMIIQYILRVKIMIYMQAMMVCDGFGMKIWNVVSKK